MADGVLAIAIVSICHNLVLIQAQVLVVEWSNSPRTRVSKKGSP